MPPAAPHPSSLARGHNSTHKDTHPCDTPNPTGPGPYLPLPASHSELCIAHPPHTHVMPSLLQGLCTSFSHCRVCHPGPPKLSPPRIFNVTQEWSHPCPSYIIAMEAATGNKLALQCPCPTVAALQASGARQAVSVVGMLSQGTTDTRIPRVSTQNPMPNASVAFSFST